MTFAWKIVICVAAITFSSAADAQVFFSGRSTAAGDWASSQADYERALGESERNRAIAYNQYMWGNEKRLANEYSAYSFQRQVNADRLEAAQIKTDMLKNRAAEKATAFEQEAESLVEAHQLGMFKWPATLERPEYADSLSTIDCALKELVGLEGTTTKFARHALETEATLLRLRVSTNSQIDFNSRVKAVRLLKLLQRVASLPNSQPDARLAQHK